MFGFGGVLQAHYANQADAEAEFWSDVDDDVREGIPLDRWHALPDSPTSERVLRRAGSLAQPDTAWTCVTAYTATVDGRQVDVPVGARVPDGDPIVATDPTKWEQRQRN